jgi:hypothetical protein
MPEDLEHTIYHYENLFKQRKPMEAYQLISIGYRNLHAKYSDLEIWGKEDKRVLLEVIENKYQPRNYIVDFEYNLIDKDNSEIRALAQAVKERNK